jgi:hypothetical protein
MQTGSKAIAAEARKFARSYVHVAARLAGRGGVFLGDCTIRDLSLVGAQIIRPAGMTIPEELYLVDLANRIGYHARLVWWRPGAAGLAFQATYPIDDSLPKELAFLRRLLIDAKLKEVDALTASGHSLADAVEKAGLSREAYARWSGEQASDGGMTKRLWQLEAENAALRKMMRPGD